MYTVASAVVDVMRRRITIFCTVKSGKQNTIPYKRGKSLQLQRPMMKGLPLKNFALLTVIYAFVLSTINFEHESTFPV